MRAVALLVALLAGYLLGVSDLETREAAAFERGVRVGYFAHELDSWWED